MPKEVGSVGRSTEKNYWWADASCWQILSMFWGTFWVKTVSHVPGSPARQPVNWRLDECFSNVTL